MASDLRGYSADEVLNKVLNTSNDSIKVDIIAGAEYAEDAAHTTADTGNFILGVRNNTLGALGDENGDYVPFQMNALGALYVEVASSSVDDSIFVDNAGFTLTTSKVNVAGGVYQSSTPGTLNDNDAGAILLNSTAGQMVELMASSAAIGSVSVSNLLADGHAVTIDNIASNEVYVRGSGTAGTADAGVVTVQGIASGTAQPVSGTFFQSTQPVSLASVPSHAVTNGGTFAVQEDGSALTALQLIDDTVAVLGTATYTETSTKGSVVGAVRNDTLATLADTDNEIAPLQVNASGALYTTEASGQAGSIFVADTSAITSKISGTVFTAIQFIEDTVFNSGNAGLISATNQLYPSSQYEGTDIDDDGFVVDGVTFPQGMTIFGRWTGFTLVSGKVIAYIGYV